MTFAIHSLHVPARETDDQGRITLNGRDWFNPGDPIHEPFQTKEDAEQWRADRLGRGNDGAS